MLVNFWVREKCPKRIVIEGKNIYKNSSQGSNFYLKGVEREEVQNRNFRKYKSLLQEIFRTENF